MRAVSSASSSGSWKRTRNIFEADQIVLERVRPELLPFDLRAANHTKADANGLAYCRMREDTVIPSPRAFRFPNLPISGS
jgi:hypothetical protein